MQKRFEKSALPDHRPDHQEKYARIDRIIQGAEPQLVCRYKMNSDDNTLDSFKRAKELFENDKTSPSVCCVIAGR